MRKRTAAQKRAEWERVYDSEAFVQWTQSRRSVASGRGPCVAAHVTPDEGLPSGTSRKADAYWIVPLTLEEERDKHRGEKTFEAKWGVNLANEAREHWANWKALEI
ncbi:MAG: hypothetical protein KAJ55_00210 [Anaerolineales bacterium]|nr:hypothetical protein [Anaerolineales bacterium]